MGDLPIFSPPSRVVSLVPSTTESLFVLGFGNSVVGITDYCSEPAEQVKGIQRVGGPKTLRIDDIIRLFPDLIIANQEENSKPILEELIHKQYPVWLTFPKTISQSLNDLLRLAGVYQSPWAVSQIQHLLRLIDPFEAALLNLKPLTYFCPIWQSQTPDGIDWWMTFNQDTYPHDVFRLFGGHNVFAHRKRKYPLEADLGLRDAEPIGDRDDRYPCVSVQEILDADPEIIFLPTEPYLYQEFMKKMIVEKFSDTKAVRTGRIYIIDGKWITWHGVHIIHAIKNLPGYFESGEGLEI